jgi:hypothetical protein
MTAIFTSPFVLFEKRDLKKFSLIQLCFINVLACASITCSTTYAAQIDIPLDTWVARPLPGIGKAPASGQKHERVAYNPLNGRLYYLGGDYAGPNYGASGRNEVYSYSVESDEWIQEQPYCRSDKGYQPSGPDQVGWTYDSKRKVFWMFPGYMTRTSQTNCADSDKVLLGQIMSFDPVTKTWAFENRTNSTGGPSIKKFGHYDPVTDTFIRFAWMGYPRMEIYHIDSDTWEYKTFSKDFDSAYLGYDYNAMDAVDRVLYVVSALEGKLLKYDMDTRALSYISDLPTGPTQREGNYPLWDSVNRVLLWAVGGSGTPTSFYVYHPTENRWEPRPINQPDGLTVKGNAAIFDPAQNVLVLIGGYEPSNPYLFLYRYANGNGTLPPPPVSDTTPPNVISANTNSNRNAITILYSEKVNQADAENVSNYSIDGVIINQATLAADQRTVSLAVSDMTDGSQYQIFINNIHDLAKTPNNIDNNTSVSVTYTAPGTNQSTTLPANYEWDTLAIDKLMYIDRTYTLSDIPDSFIGLEFLRTGNDDKSKSADPFVSFTIPEPKAVFVAYDMRITPLPTWLQTWQSTAFEITGTDYPLRLYRKDFEAGAVNLGGNEYGNSMYIVVLGDVNMDNDSSGPGDNPDDGNDSEVSGGSVDGFFGAALVGFLSVAIRRKKYFRSTFLRG